MVDGLKKKLFFYYAVTIISSEMSKSHPITTAKKFDSIRGESKMTVKIIYIKILYGQNEVCRVASY